MDIDTIDNKNLNKEDVTIKELFFLIKSKLNILFFSISFFLFLSTIYLLATRPIYVSSGSIIIDEENSTMSSIFDVGMGNDMNYLENEIEVLKSRTTSERAIKSLFQSKYKNNLHLFNSKEYEDGILRTLIRNLFFLDWDNNIISEINYELNDSLLNHYVQDLRENLSISNKRNTDVLKVSYSSHDPSESSLIINTIIDVYQKRDQEWAAGEMSHLKIFLIDQLEIKQSDLNIIEEELKTFQEKEHIYGLDNNSNLLLNQLTVVESNFYNTQAKKNILQERKKYFRNQLNEDEKLFAERVTNTLDVQLYSIRQELSSLEAEYISTKSKEGESHPAVIDLNKKIINLKKLLNKETQKYVNQGINVANPIQFRQNIMDSVINLDALISGYDSKLNELGTLVLQYENDLSSLPNKYLQFSRLHRDKVILDETYSLMKQKLEEAKINEASQLGKIRIVDIAKPNYNPASPSTKLSLFIGIFLGVIFGISIIIGTQFLDSTVKSMEEIERRGIPILAIIPSIGVIKSSKKEKKKGYRFNLKASAPEKIERRLLTHEDPKSPISEAYRSLRTSLMYDNDEENCKIMLVSSSGPGEGKTTTVANLAITYANMGKKTLLVDSDLRKPVIHKMFKNDISKGFTNFLMGKVEHLKEIVYDCDVKNLNILKSGPIPSNPSELLSSKHMSKFIEQAKDQFDVVLFDTPPMIAVTDAMIIHKYVDKVLLVVRASVTQKGALDRTLVNMSNVSRVIDGAIFNGVDETNTYGGGYYYNYYQYYYGAEEK